MKTIAILLALLGAVASLLAQGRVNFMNSSATLISAGGAAMPPASTSQFIFAVFLAPSGTVTGVGQTVSFDDPRFQLAGAYDTNAAVAGRIITRNNVDVTSAGGNPNHFGEGSTVDYVVRGWSANAGATWQEALAAYHNWGSIPMYIGTSAVGDNLVLGDGAVIPTPNLFGSGATQVGGFNMYPPSIDPPCPNPHLTMLTPLTNQTVVQGDTATFYFGFIACPYPNVVWTFQGITNAYFIPYTGSQVVINNAQPTNSGRYHVECYNYWNGGWHTIYSSATLTVLVPPTITGGPLSQSAETGARVRLSVRATGDLPLVYRWMFNGTNVLTVAINSVLELDNVGSLQAGSYTVVVTNAVGAVTSAPALLSVIAPVERRLVPGVTLMGEVGSYLALDCTTNLRTGFSWLPMDSVSLTSTSQLYFDLSTPLPPQRFYRAWQATTPTNPPSLGLNMIPALTLTGTPGNQIRVDAINQFGPTDAWFTLDTLTLTNTSQLCFDVTAPGQPARLYRLVPVP